jgi:hypothetical protein
LSGVSGVLIAVFTLAYVGIDWASFRKSNQRSQSYTSFRFVPFHSIAVDWVANTKLHTMVFVVPPCKGGFMSCDCGGRYLGRSGLANHQRSCLIFKSIKRCTTCTFTCKTEVELDEHKNLCVFRHQHPPPHLPPHAWQELWLMGT